MFINAYSIYLQLPSLSGGLLHTQYEEASYSGERGPSNTNLTVLIISQCDEIISCIQCHIKCEYDLDSALEKKT
jgi:hypothetical protein